MASRKGSSAKATATAAADQEQLTGGAELNPVYEWLDGGENYLLRLSLQGFKKEDFSVHVDPAGRLTIRGQRPAGGGGAGSVRLDKVFQLPPTSDHDKIAGRYDGGVLTLTVPKLPPSEAAPVPPRATKEEDAVADKPTDKKSKVEREAERRIEAARAVLSAGRHRDEEKQAGRSEKPPPPAPEKAEEATSLSSQTAAERRSRQDEDKKAKADEQHKAKVVRDAERWIDEARERLAAETTERERATAEGFKWAETIGRKKEVIATAVAAFALGAFVTHKLFCRK